MISIYLSYHCIGLIYYTFSIQDLISNLYLTLDTSYIRLIYRDLY